jgi:translocation and assembly module TamA
MKRGKMVLALVAAMAQAPAGHALDTLDFTTPGADSALESSLRAASLLLVGKAENTTSAQDLFAAARADYARLIGVLYSEAHYSGVIHILLDGREAADIAPLDAPATISTIRVSVTPGPAFTFSTAEIAPLAPGTRLPAEFSLGAPAGSGTIRDAVDVAIAGWRSNGHAKAATAGQKITADHGQSTLAASVAIAPGPKVRFGDLAVTGQTRMRLDRIHEIAGFPTGEVFDPALMQRSADRLRRTGVFRSVALTEADTLSPDDTLAVAAAVVEDKRRRYGFGAEIASLDGLSVTGYWLHRNLLGGAERLTIDGEVANLGARGSGVDYRLGTTLERPATFTPDTTLTFGVNLARLDDADQVADTINLGGGLSHIFSDTLTVTAGLDFHYTRVTETGSNDVYIYRNLALPIGATSDRRDSKLDATRGFYLAGEARPFVGLGSTDSGGRFTLDARAYRSFGAARPVVLAGRVQAGAILGASLVGTPRDYLFYSGGGGTVRGQPYQSLGVSVINPGQTTGGTSFLAASVEARAKLGTRLGAVAFYDIGFVGAGDSIGQDGSWHSGAGLGLRYDTGFGPIRLDVASPVSGTTGAGVQVYVGIGQSF